MEHGADEPQVAGAPSAQRLDKWLWFARVVKSRTMASGLVTSGKVRVNRVKVDKPSHALKFGDVVTVNVGRKARVLRVVAMGVRRGPATEAQGLFEELTESVASSISGGSAALPGDAAGRDAGNKLAGMRVAGAGRPTKRDRRLIDQFRGRR